MQRETAGLRVDVRGLPDGETALRGDAVRMARFNEVSWPLALALGVVDLVRPDPVVQGPCADAELGGGRGDRFPGRERARRPGSGTPVDAVGAQIAAFQRGPIFTPKQLRNPEAGQGVNQTLGSPSVWIFSTAKGSWESR